MQICLWGNGNVQDASARASLSNVQTTVKQMQEDLKNFSSLYLAQEKIEKVFPKNTTLRVLVHEGVPNVRNLLISRNSQLLKMTPYNLYVLENNSTHRLTGFIAEMWKILETDLQFRSEYHAVSFEEGRDILKARNADIMLSPVVVDSKNLDDFDITIPIATSLYSLYMRPFSGRGTSAFYLGTWSRNLWLSFVSVLILCALLLWAISGLRKKFGLDERILQKDGLDGKYANKTKQETDYLSLADCLYMVLGAATQQDMRFQSEAGSLRVLLFVLLIFNTLLTTSYTSTIVSRLTVTQNSYKYISLETILTSNPLFVCVRINSAVYPMFQTNDSSEEVADEWKNLVNRGPCHPSPKNTVDVASNICKRRCVIFESDNIMARLLAKDRECNTERLRTTRIISQISILIRKHFEFTHHLRRGILKLMDTGVLQLLETRFLYKNRPQYRVQRYSEVTWGNVKALVIMYAVAAGFSLLLLVVEICIGRHILKRKIKK
ncbi:hypothetical protein J6590_047489 [Homalodisca vitripennis]|nr:hypothetical protein J6590_047489 [Homalodisca vitripennis]